MWGERLGNNRVVEDLVSFVDFAPTFLQAAGVDIPGYMAGRSLFDIFEAAGSGTLTDYRRRVYMGRERHDMGREGDLGYPVRCVRTSRYLYIRNFTPTRWPAGNPETGYTGCDSSPVKARIIELEKEGCRYYWQLAFGKRPLEELYDIREDPRCLTNLAAFPAFQELKDELWQDLRNLLIETGDPRIKGNGAVFDTYEYYVDAPHSWEHYLKGDWLPQGY
jgi:arylsulfatase A-like enzyme